MRIRIDTRRVCAVIMAVGLLSGPEGAAQTSTLMSRALDRAVVRINTRADLSGHREAGFNRDSFDVRAMSGLSRTSDSTLVGWFTGFSRYVEGIDSIECQTLMKEEPSGSSIAAVASSMDSASVESWVGLWEKAVVAAYLDPVQPKVDDEEMMEAIFTLIGKLNDGQVTFSSKPNRKPAKPSTPAQECRTMRQFFTEALALPDPMRMTLFRGLAQSMMEKGASTFTIEQ